MKRSVAPAAFALLLSCGGAGDRREYSQNDLMMLTAFSAKAQCSCLFVMEMDEAFCTAWSKQNPPLARYDVDTAKKQVRASALVLWAATARWIDARNGCALVE